MYYLSETTVNSQISIVDHCFLCLCYFRVTIIADPTVVAERLTTVVITVVVTSDGKLCSIHKPGIRK